MNFEEAKYPNKARVKCNSQNKRLYGKHKLIPINACDSKAKQFGPSQKSLTSQEIKLLKNVALFKMQIIEISSKLIASIENSVKESLTCLEKQKTFILNIIKNSKSKDKINELLEITPFKIFEHQNLARSMVDLERIFCLNEIKKKIQEIENKFIKFKCSPH